MVRFGSSLLCFGARQDLTSWVLNSAAATDRSLPSGMLTGRDAFDMLKVHKGPKRPGE